MKFSVFYPVGCYDDKAVTLKFLYDRAFETAKVAEKLGFYSIFFNEGHARHPNYKLPNSRLLIAACAQHTSTILLRELWRRCRSEERGFLSGLGSLQRCFSSLQPTQDSWALLGLPTTWEGTTSCHSFCLPSIPNFALPIFLFFSLRALQSTVNFTVSPFVSLRARS